jgi:hypothetical protein
MQRDSKWNCDRACSREEENETGSKICGRHETPQDEYCTDDNDSHLVVLLPPKATSFAAAPTAVGILPWAKEKFNAARKQLSLRMGKASAMDMKDAATPYNAPDDFHGENATDQDGIRIPLNTYSELSQGFIVQHEEERISGQRNRCHSTTCIECIALAMVKSVVLRVYTAVDEARKIVSKRISNVMSTPECLACMMICAFVGVSAFVIAINILAFDIAPARSPHHSFAKHGLKGLEESVMQRLEAAAYSPPGGNATRQ